MANLAGFDTSAVGNMLNHYSRHADDPHQVEYTFRNQAINPALTHLNYCMFTRANPKAFIAEQIHTLDMAPRCGKNATNVISDWIITMPKNEALEGRDREFFQAVYAAMCEKVPPANIVSAWVHMDEENCQPHMHFCFMPIVETARTENDKTRPLLDAHGVQKVDSKGTLRWERMTVRDEHGNPITRRTLSQAKMFDKAEMRKFHPWLEGRLEQHFGFRTGIMLEDPGAKQLSHLSHEEYKAATQTLERLAVEQVTAEAETHAAKAAQVAEVAELSRLQGENAKNAARAAEIENEISKKMAEKAEIEAQISDFSEKCAAEQDRLELLRRDREAADGRVANLERAIAAARAEAATQPPVESVQESLGTVFQGLGAGSRERELAAENQRLREQCSGLERRVHELGERAKQLRSAVEQLRGAVGAALRAGVRAIVPSDLVERAIKFMRRCGIEGRAVSTDAGTMLVTGGASVSLADEAEQARRAAREMSRERTPARDRAARRGRGR